MAQVCIYTLDPLERGGVMAKVHFMVDLLRQSGHHPNLLYTATGQLPLGKHGQLQYFRKHLFPFWTNYENTPGLALPYWPLPIWLIYLMPWIFGRAAFTGKEIHLVISGANHCGLPAALARKRYIIWIGTLYDDELTGKALAGDANAGRLRDGFHGSILRWEEKLIFERAALILTNGEHTAARLREKLPWVAHKVRAAIYPVDTDMFKPDPSQLVDMSTTPYILITARINDPRKDVGMLFRAYARVREQHPEVRLILAGDQPGTYVYTELDKSGMNGHVEFVGRQSLPDLVRLYQGAAVFALSSKQEGLGISMLEALACGVPVVATRCGGPDSFIIDGEIGYLVPVDDDEAMANHILHLLDNPEQMKKMRAASSAYARRTFSRSAAGDILLRALQEVYPEHFLI